MTSNRCFDGVPAGGTKREYIHLDDTCTKRECTAVRWWGKEGRTNTVRSERRLPAPPPESFWAPKKTHIRAVNVLEMHWQVDSALTHLIYYCFALV